jgi:alpha-L-fucosidase
MKKKYILFLIFSIMSLSCQRNKELSLTEMRSEWTKMNASSSKQETMDWFQQSKFGMFIHFGLYSIPAGIWDGKKMEDWNRSPGVAEWIQYVAQIPREEYAKLAGEFNPDKFNGDSIAKLASDAGMKYIVITSKHHDGFAMYDSKVSDFNIVDATPYGRDVLKELYNACKKYGLEFGIYYSHNIDWADGADCQYNYFKGISEKEGKDLDYFGSNLWDPSPNTFKEYLNNKAYPQVKELLNRFPDMKCLWYDMARFMMPEQSYYFYKIAYDIQPQMIITNRIGNDFGDYDITGDNLIPQNPDTIVKPWETVGTLNNSWGFKSYDNDWKSAKELLFWLVEIVSKGGNYMLNVGPKGSGEIPEESIIRLREMGKWLKINGDAIYGTDRWLVTHEGPTNLIMDGTDARQAEGFSINFSPEDFWFTKKDNRIFVIAIEYPKERATIKSLKEEVAGKIINVRLLGFDGPVEWEQTSKGLEVLIPEPKPNKDGYVIEVTVG